MAARSGEPPVSCCVECRQPLPEAVIGTPQPCPRGCDVHVTTIKRQSVTYVYVDLPERRSAAS